MSDTEGRQRSTDRTGDHRHSGDSVNLQRRDLRILISSDFDSLEETWVELERNGDGYVFQSFDWLKHWYESTARESPVQLCLTLVESAAGDALMLLPLGIVRRGVTNCLVWLGGALSDYHGPLLHREFSARVDADRFLRLWEQVLASLPPVDVVAFEKQPASIGAQKNPFLHLAVQQHPSDAHYMTLSGTIDAIVRSKRTAKSISNDRRKERRLGEHGPVCFVVADSAGAVGRLLPTFFQQKSSGYRSLGVADLFASDGNRRFLEHLSSDSSATRILLCALNVGDDVAATFWGPVYRNRLYYLFPAYAQNRFARYSPGNILLRSIMTWCLENAVDVLDFTVGDEPYKFTWRDGHMKLYDHFQHRSATGWLHVRATSAQRRLKRWVKHSPRLFDAYRAVRKRFAGTGAGPD